MKLGMWAMETEARGPSQGLLTVLLPHWAPMVDCSATRPVERPPRLMVFPVQAQPNGLTAQTSASTSLPSHCLHLVPSCRPSLWLLYCFAAEKAAGHYVVPRKADPRDLNRDQEALATTKVISMESLGEQLSP